MASQIKVIKDRIVALLVADTVALGVDVANIHDHQLQKITDDKMPAIVVSVGPELVVDKPVESNVLEHKRRVQISVDLVVSSESNAENAALELMDKVETTLFKHDIDTEDDTWSKMEYTGMDVNYDNQGKTNYAIMTLKFDCDYYKEVEYTALPNLEGVDVVEKLNVNYTSGSGQAVAGDNIDV